MASRTTPNRWSQPLRGADFERAHSSVVLGEDVRSLRRGFTIVELLIVVVVIAILAAITIVAYNGITNRAKNSAASTAAEQAAKKVMTYAVTNSDNYPASLSDVGVSDGSTTYQYRVDNTANPKTFCITATMQNVSYWVSNAAATPTVGVCAGHGAAGQTVITNMIANPSFEATSGASVVGFPSGARATAETSSVGVLSGLRSLKLTPTYSVSTDTYVELSNPGFEPETTYTALLGYTLTEPLTNGAPRLRIAVGGLDLYSPSGPQTIGTHEIRWTFTTGPTTQFNFMRIMPGGKLGDPSIYVDNFLLVKGSYSGAYADGSSPGWAWNGAPNSSTSTGPGQ